MTLDKPCKLFEGKLNNKGYGQKQYNGRNHTAHRVAWIEAHGPVPEGLEIDHLCKVRNCVEVTHLEAVTHRENVRRSFGICPHGAAFGRCDTCKSVGAQSDTINHMRQPATEILHIRMPLQLRQSIEARAQEEQRTVADMIRILVGYAIAKMPHYTGWHKDFGNLPEASHADVTTLER